MSKLEGESPYAKVTKEAVRRIARRVGREQGKSPGEYTCVTEDFADEVAKSLSVGAAVFVQSGLDHLDIKALKSDYDLTDDEVDVAEITRDEIAEVFSRNFGAAWGEAEEFRKQNKQAVEDIKSEVDAAVQVAQQKLKKEIEGIFGEGVVTFEEVKNGDESTVKINIDLERFFGRQSEADPEDFDPFNDDPEPLENDEDTGVQYGGKCNCAACVAYNRRVGR